MWTSARIAEARARRPRAGAAGFTLIEVMCALAIFALLILPMLSVRQSASNMAYRSGHMLTALGYGERLLAERMTNPDQVKQLQGVIEDDRDYRYELTIEDFDLSTGRVDEPEEEGAGFTQGTSFSTVSAFVPGDAGKPEETEDTKLDAYKVRRYKVTIFYPGQREDSEDKLVLEGYSPRATDTETASLLGAK